MQFRTILFTLVLISFFSACGPKRLYESDTAGPGEVAIINIESSPTNTIEDVVINDAGVSPATIVKVASGDQQISFKYYYEDRENTTLSPPFHGVCKGSFFARPDNTYSVTSSGVYLNQAKETRFWVVQPNREDVASLECTKIDETVRAKVLEQDISGGVTQQSKGMWDTIVEPFKPKPFDPTAPVAAPVVPDARSRY